MRPYRLVSVVGDNDAVVLPELSLELRLAFAWYYVTELQRERSSAMSVAAGRA